MPFSFTPPAFMRHAARLLSAGCVAAATALPAGAHAAYPERPVTIVVPVNTGTTPDIVTRLLASVISKDTGGNFVVQNKVGASGIIGTQYVANQPADGYTLAFANVATLAINQSLYS
jgi:tripartite-type tricarboxylate transporter receptor subunit TctC